MGMRFSVWPGRRSRRVRLATRALCGVLALALPASAAHAQSAPGAPVPPGATQAVPPTQAAPPTIDPWMSPDGNAPPPAYAADAYGAPAAGYPGAPGAEGGGMIQVDVRADEAGVRLDRVQGQGMSTAVCVAPCSKLVPRNNLYVIDGDGIRATSQFLLPDDRNQVTLNVKAGSSARHGGGAVLLVGGLIVGYVGLVGLAATESSTGSQSDRAATIGGGLLIGGVAAAIGGLYLVMTSSTTVTSSTGATFSKNDQVPERAPSRAGSSVALTPRGLTF